MKRKTFATGFTIMELIVVIAVIGVLAAIISLIFTSTKAEARDARREKDIRAFQTALNIYQATHTTYPLVSDGSVIIDGTDELTLKLRDEDALEAGSRDPVHSFPYVYIYTSSPEGTSYTLTYCLETKNPCERQATP